MRSNQKLLHKALLVGILLWTIPMFATTYEDAEDNTTTGWLIYGDTAGATVENIYDFDRGSRVIQFNGSGKETGFRLGNRGGRASYVGAWNNQTEKVLKWSMNYSEAFSIYVSILTEEGNRYLVYTNQSTDTKGIIRGKKVRYGLGEDSIDGTWHTFIRDLEADWNAFESNNSIISVNGFFIRGSGKVDDISLLPVIPVTHIYEDAEDNTTTGWVIYGDTTDATVTNVYDNNKTSQVIQLMGNGKETGFRLGNRGGRASYVGAWNNQTEKVLKWSMNYSEDFSIYVSLLTEEGNRYLVYTNQSTDTKGIIRGKKVRYGLGEDSIDGTWHTFMRDLEADWNAFESNNSIISVNGFFIRGSGKVDDISLNSLLLY